MNITEDYCSYEVAKLLKEKGFNIPSMGRYSIRSKEFHLDCTRMCNNGGLSECAAPTHQMTMKWLRTKDIYIYIQPTKYVGGALYGFQAIVEDGRNSAWKKSIHHEENYEDAVEAALKYCLENLI